MERATVPEWTLRQVKRGFDFFTRQDLSTHNSQLSSPHATEQQFPLATVPLVPRSAFVGTYKPSQVAPYGKCRCRSGALADYGNRVVQSVCPPVAAPTTS